MPRPLTKSPPIQFRLPLDLYTILEQRAAAKGQTPIEFVRDYVTRALETLR
jgi:hypothetical protein